MDVINKILNVVKKQDFETLVTGTLYLDSCSEGKGPILQTIFFHLLLLLTFAPKRSSGPK